MTRYLVKTKCKCLENEFCDVCVKQALDKFVKEGKLKMVLDKGEWKYVNA